jgi:hypothetical protein
MKTIALMLAAGILSTIVGVEGSQWRYSFQIPRELQIQMLRMRRLDEELLQQVDAAQRVAWQRNSMLVASIYGAGLGLFAALAAAAVAGRHGRPVMGGSLGIAAGLAAGAGGGLLNCLIFEQLWLPQREPLLNTALSHGAYWVLMAGVFAVVVAVASRRPVLLHLGGVSIICAGIAATLYPFVAAAAFPLQPSDQPIPDGTATLLLWFSLPSLMFTLAAGRILHKAYLPVPAPIPVEASAPPSVG